MKTCVVLLCLAAVVVLAGAAKVQKYTTKYDNVNVQDILSNDRLFNNYYKCLVNNGPCTPDGQELKNSLKDALQTKCSKCSEKQKEGSKVVFKFLLDKKPQQYAELEKTYDPKGIYRAQYKAEAAKEGVKL